MVAIDKRTHINNMIDTLIAMGFGDNDIPSPPKKPFSPSIRGDSQKTLMLKLLHDAAIKDVATNRGSHSLPGYNHIQIRSLIEQLLESRTPTQQNKATEQYRRAYSEHRASKEDRSFSTRTRHNSENIISR